LNFRSALVIVKSELFRCSMVDYRKHRGWIVHGVRRVEQAFPILQQIPYHLILIDCDTSEMTGTELDPTVHELCRRQATRLVVITESSGRSSAARIAKRGVFFAKKIFLERGRLKGQARAASRKKTGGADGAFVTTPRSLTNRSARSQY
jgi:PleD family two-component response regulator